VIMSRASKQPPTVAANNGIAGDTRFGAVVPPLYLTSTFAFAGYERTRGYDYTRTANPSRDLLADTLAKLERGAGAVVTASGMAAIDLVLSRLRRGDLLVAPHDCYAGTYRLLTARKDRDEFQVVFVDQGDDAALSTALKKRPALVLVETPSNQLMRVVDIRKVATLAKAAGAKVAVDNTFLSPALQQPIALGADFVIHSTTKYLNGHSDIVGGAVIAADPEEIATLSYWANVVGVIGAPFDSYMTLRGVRTLFVRIAQQQANALAVARYLRTQPQVSAVHYPGLADHPGHTLAASQQAGFGAMLSFELRDGTPAVQRFIEAVEVFTLAESLGGVESLLAHPATMTHAAMGAEARRVAGISDGLLRLSVGLEDSADLINGLAAGFAAISP
jgi:cystathionine gamma-synthase